MTEAARLACSMNLKIKGVVHLEQQIRGYQLLHQNERRQISELQAELANRYMLPDPLQIHADQILADLFRNREVHPTKRQYLFESRVWAREIHDISVAAYQVPSGILPLPSDRLLRSKFLNEKARIQKAMFDLNDVDDLLSIWRTANNVDAEDRVDEILSVDAVAFKPLVTIREDGSVEDIADFDCLESSDLFSQLIANPTLFHQFVLSHWKKVYSSLFAFHIQHVHEQFTCCAIHAIQVRNGKGTPQTVCKLKQIHELLTQRGFDIVGYVFDGDSCYDQLHKEFEKIWRLQLQQLHDLRTFLRALFVMSSSPLILSMFLKRIMYRLVSFDAHARGHDSEYFSLHRIQAHVLLQPVVFQNTKVTKMHDSLPLHLFSQCTTHSMFAEAFEAEFFAFFLWFLMISALSYREHSTKIRCSFLETVF
jgi:hypothetical protein